MNAKNDFDQYVAQRVKHKYVARAFLITRPVVTCKHLSDF